MALLVYAQSCDIAVPNFLIHRLYDNLYGSGQQSSRRPEYQASSSTEFIPGPRHHTPRPQVRSEVGDTYLAAKVREALVQSKHTGALGIEVFIQDGQVLVRGQIQSEEQHRAIVETIRQMAPKLRIEDQLQVSDWKAPTEIEALQ